MFEALRRGIHQELVPLFDAPNEFEIINRASELVLKTPIEEQGRFLTDIGFLSILHSAFKGLDEHRQEELQKVANSFHPRYRIQALNRFNLLIRNVG